MKVTAYIGLGSNLGDKEDNLLKALDLLNQAPEVDVIRVAPFYRTAPVGYTGQDWFLNTVAEVETALTPGELLSLLLAIENELGRVRTVRWGPRTADLDLLLYGDAALNEPDLIVPHPRMHERAFVMAPLADLAPDLAIRGRGKASAMAAELAKEQEIQKYLKEFSQDS
ncbi:MAG: 2-amino-4-hydroxy-6-hydroxymethyldihydropteridine diphosphokinase [Firmicutes bacterium]|nr:2-amino-4-hydroxy-6-hydroxymethyldihydropteridine diphosphokinase [Bacillota bacterium]